MVRELEGDAAPELHLVVDLRGSLEAADRAVSRAAGVARSALSSRQPVVLHTAEAGGPRSGAVTSPSQVGRRLAYAVSNAGPSEPSGLDAVVVSASDEGPDRRVEHAAPVAKETALRRLARINARQPAEEDGRVRIAAFGAAFTAALAVLVQSVGGPGFRLLVLAGLPVGFLVSWWTRHRPGYLTKLGLALGAVLALVWFLRTLSGVTGGTVADAQTPLAELVLLVQILQTFDATAPRDLRFSVLVSAVVMATAGLLSISLGLLPYVMAWAVAGVATMVLTHRGALVRLPVLAPPGRGGVAVGANRRAALGLQGGLALGLALVIGLGLFVIAPAAGTAQALFFPAAIARIVSEPADGGLDNPSLGAANPAGRFAAEVREGRRVPAGRLPFGYFGFSNELDLAARGRPDDTLVMRVRANHEAMWMGEAFDVWDGRRWTMSNQRSIPIGGALPLSVLPPVEQGGDMATGPTFIQTYYVVQPGANLVLAADPAVQVYLPAGHLDELTDGTLRSSVALGPGAIYTVVSQPALVISATLRQAGPADVVPASISRRYAQPPPTTARVRRLALDVTAVAPTTYDKVVSLEAWIGAHTRYSLNPPPLPPGADAVDRFLFVDRKGFCEQIATSLVVMLRSLGIPSRLAVGYAGGTRDPLTGVFDVHASDAHSWAEVWFPGVGWQPFDPTASVPLAGDAGGSAASGLLAFLSGPVPSIPLPAAVGACSLAGVGLLGAGFRRLTRTRRRRTALERARPVPSWAASCQERLEAVVAPLTRPREPGETIQEYVAAVAPELADVEVVRALADLVDRSAFSGVDPSSGERAWAREVLDGIAGDVQAPARA
jgi:protein-glutamine gamma-glutamyltransferase